MINKEFDNIKIPDNINDAIDMGIDRIRKEKNSIKKRKKRIIEAIAASLTFIILLGISNQTFAENIPILKNVFKLFENNYIKTTNIPKYNYSEYTDFIGLTVEDNGIKINIQEVMYDGKGGMYVSYKVESSEPFGYNTTSYPINYEIDPIESTAIIDENTEYETKSITNMWIEQNNSVSYSEAKLDSWNIIEGSIIDENTFAGIICYWVPNTESGEYPQSFEAKINISEVSLPYKIQDWNNVGIEGNEKYSVKGNWSFNIPVKISNSFMAETKETVINEEKDGFLLEKIIEDPHRITAKIVPLNEENQKNLKGYRDKVLQLHGGYLLGSEGIVQLSWSQPMVAEAITNENKDVPGTFYIGISKEIGDEKGEEYEIVVEDNLRGGQPCTKDCENLEYHKNSIHPTIIKFDTKISNKY
ncbi:DUF4179 domain-containing protein [Clostridium sp.]|uniref:DUF4179 domain-containing protein n=1 Tax=Clostridium sp. TaxID=1506 RepID=UPI00261BBCD8|nr:DUF4179 domain-containing protein [Clostridium sp.]